MTEPDTQETSAWVEGYTTESPCGAVLRVAARNAAPVQLPTALSKLPLQQRYFFNALVVYYEPNCRPRHVLAIDKFY